MVKRVKRKQGLEWEAIGERVIGERRRRRWWEEMRESRWEEEKKEEDDDDDEDNERKFGDQVSRCNHQLNQNIKSKFNHIIRILIWIRLS